MSDRKQSKFQNPQQMKDASKIRDSRNSWSKLTDAERMALRKLEQKIGSTDAARYKMGTGTATFTSLRDGLTVREPTLVRLRSRLKELCIQYEIVTE